MTAVAPAWFVAAGSVTINAIDPGGSGVAVITYRINQGTVQQATGESVVVPVTGQGTTTITYSATDAAGNKSADATVTVRIDGERPQQCSVTSERSAKRLVHQQSDGDDHGERPLSGVASIDWSTAPPAFTTVANSANANPFSTNVAITAEGNTTVTYNAVDIAGNRSANARSR